jgi:hypothetical protein
VDEKAVVIGGGDFPTESFDKLLLNLSINDKYLHSFGDRI